MIIYVSVDDNGVYKPANIAGGGPTLRPSTACCRGQQQQQQRRCATLSFAGAEGTEESVTLGHGWAR